MQTGSGPTSKTSQDTLQRGMFLLISPFTQPSASPHEMHYIPEPLHEGNDDACASLAFQIRPPSTALAPSTVLCRSSGCMLLRCAPLRSSSQGVPLPRTARGLLCSTLTCARDKKFIAHIQAAPNSLLAILRDQPYREDMTPTKPYRPCLDARKAYIRSSPLA